MTPEEAVSLRSQFDTLREAADAAGLSRHAFRRRLLAASEQGHFGLDPVMPGFAIKRVSSKYDGAWVTQTHAPGDEFELPEGHSVKGVSALVDGEGRVIQSWIKTKNEYSALDVAETIKLAFSDYAGRAEPLPAPRQIRSEILTLTPCNDWHIGMYAWGQETGSNWNLAIAEQQIGQAIEDLVDRSPSSAVAVVLGGGDILHADDSENRTARSGNALDAGQRC